LKPLICTADRADLVTGLMREAFEQQETTAVAA
jgi:hypothetical protein